MRINRNRRGLAAKRAIRVRSTTCLRHAATTAAMILAGGLCWTSPAPATTYTWDPNNTPATPSGGTGSWDLTTSAWSSGATDNLWTDVAGVTPGGTDTDTAIFGGTAGTVTLNAPLGAAAVVFTTPNYNLVSSGNINTSNGTGNILFLGTSTAALDATAIGSGSLTLPNVEIEDNAIPTNGQMTTASQTWNCGSAAITVGGELINFGAANSLTLNGTGTTTLAGGLALSYTTSSKKFTFIGSENVNITGPVVNSINGSGGSANSLSYNGTGILTLSGINTYQGTTVFDSGTMQLGSNTALGASAFTFGDPSSTYTPVMSTATLMATGGAITIANTVLIDGQVSPSNGFPVLPVIGGSKNLTFSGTVVGGTTTNELIVNNTATTTISGPLDLSNSTNTRTLNLRGTGNLTISGVIGDSNVSGGSPGNLTYNGAGGTLTLSGINTYSGTTTFYSGTLAVTNSLSLGNSSFIFGDPSSTIPPATTAATLLALNGPVTLANPIQLSSSSTAASPVFATIGGSNNLTLSGALTSYSTTNVLVVNNTASTTLSGPIYLSRNTSSPGAITFAGSGNLTVSGSVSDANGATGANPGDLNYNGSGTLTLSGVNTYTGNTHIMGGTVALASTGALPAGTNLTIDTGAIGVADNLGTTFPLTVTSLSISGKLDLNNNAMIVHSETIDFVTSLVKAGFGVGSWNGPSGIISTTASHDPTHLTALGVIQNSVDGTPTGAVLHSTFELRPAVNTDILVKYTYYGDTNLDGSVDGSDYSRIDAAYIADQAYLGANPTGTSQPDTGWFNGDFNYDGSVDGSDYTLIDNAFNQQGSHIADEIAAPTAQLAGASGSSSVPEPATLGLLGMSMLALLGRRQRKPV